ncbi:MULTISPECIES: hypothetical protein [Flavobacterium]|uniref:Uncharacterized protein n=1 Tax=Flavobacterium panici TaxID=2654843 RepID=A0A9N8J4T0_9FLAO|nr:MULTISPECIES: hypothetical protein [Flavobacterium]UUF16670.1 hypothetical protein NLJ00_11260 [Flavobacterium panici]CAC9975524.1 hypothetical protein FLAPXU55_03238 [Flavobacterium panici]
MKKVNRIEEKKLSLEKFRIAEIKNKKVIVGGGSALADEDPPITSPTIRG